jgi:hypothetical protein
MQSSVNSLSSTTVIVGNLSVTEMRHYEISEYNISRLGIELSFVSNISEPISSSCYSTGNQTIKQKTDYLLLFHIVPYNVQPLFLYGQCTFKTKTHQISFSYYQVFAVNTENMEYPLEQSYLYEEFYYELNNGFNVTELIKGVGNFSFVLNNS